MAAPKNIEDAQKILAQVMADLYNGRMDPRRGYAIAYTANAFYKSVELHDVVLLKRWEIFAQKSQKRSHEDIQYFAEHGCWPDSPFPEQAVAEIKKNEGSAPAQVAAHRLVAANTFPEECICFPPQEQPKLGEDCVAEREAIAGVCCSLHVKRFREINTPAEFVAKWRWERDRELGWPDRSAQFRKAMLASFPQQRTDDPTSAPNAETEEHAGTIEERAKSGPSESAGQSRYSRLSTNGGARVYRGLQDH